jgi:uncharacterized membrane protein YdjX (TVP38/TMEM64 family)
VRTAGDGTWRRAAVLGLLLATATVLAVALGPPRVDAVRAWVDGAGGAAWAGLVLGVALVLMAPVPRTAVSVLLGVVLGFGPGLLLALAGGLLAGLASFGLSRTLGRAAATRLGGRRLARVDELVTDRGFVAVLAGRLLPVVPFVVLSYGAGLTAIRWAPYALATALGLVPSTIVQVGIGTSAGVLAERAGVLTLMSGAVAVLLLSGGALLVWRRRQPAAS